VRQQYRELSCDRDHGSLSGILSSSSRQVLPPAPQGTVFPERTQDLVGCFRQELPQVSIAGLRNAELRVVVTGLIAPGPQT